MGKYSFPKTEKLKSRKSIFSLFENANSAVNYPVRTIWKEENHVDGTQIKVGFSVPKKLFKKAKDRNLLKRRMREAYRLNREILYSGSDKQIKPVSVFFIYISKEKEQYSSIESSMKKLLGKMIGI